MLSPMRVLSLLMALGVTATTARDTTYFVPEAESLELLLVNQELASLGIYKYESTDATTTDAGKLWKSVSDNHKDIDLVWSTAASPPLEHLRFAKTFKTKINHVPGTEDRLTNRDELAKIVDHFQHKKEKYLFNYLPKYVQLPRDQARMPKVFEETLKRVEYEMKREDDWYIYQRFLVREVPQDGNDGSVKAAAIIATNDELQAKLSTDFKDKQVEVTQYIEPYLIDGHKFQVGFYVAITSIDPLRVYYYGHPEIKIAKAPYPSKMDTTANPKSFNFNEYIPAWDFPDLQKLYYEFPSAERPGTNSWNVLKRHMMHQGLDISHLQKQINDAIAASIASNRGYFQSRISKFQRFTAAGENDADRTDLENSFFQLLRFDFELDDLGKPWLTRVNSNPSVTPQRTVFGTDEAIKKNLLFDLFNLVGVHPQSKPSFEQFFVPSDAKFCADKCKDDGRVWDTTCWSCPGWFAPYVAHRLFDSMNEYARRGNFKLLYPALDDDYSKFLDNTLSDHDLAFNRYVKSISAAYAERQQSAVSNSAVTCVYREHCSENGDCVNGKCVCDDEYEGATCYIPKDLGREKRLNAERAAAAAKAGESWKDRLWGGRGDGAENVVDAKDAQVTGEATTSFSFGNFLFGLLFVGGFAYIGYQVFLSQTGGAILQKNN